MRILSFLFHISFLLQFKEDPKRKVVKKEIKQICVSFVSKNTERITERIAYCFCMLYPFVETDLRIICKYQRIHFYIIPYSTTFCMNISIVQLILNTNYYSNCLFLLCTALISPCLFVLRSASILYGRHSFHLAS